MLRAWRRHSGEPEDRVVEPRSSRDLAKIQPRYSRATHSRATAEMWPRCAEVQPLDPAAVASRSCLPHCRARSTNGSTEKRAKAWRYAGVSPVQTERPRSKARLEEERSVGFFFTGPAQSREALLEGAPVASHVEKKTRPT